MYVPMNHLRFDMSMEVLCTLSTAPKELAELEREFELNRAELLGHLGKIRSFGILLRMTKSPRGVHIEPQSWKRAKEMGEFYWKTVAA